MRQFENFFALFVTFAEKASPIDRRVGTASGGLERPAAGRSFGGLTTVVRVLVRAELVLPKDLGLKMMTTFPSQIQKA